MRFLIYLLLLGVFTLAAIYAAMLALYFGFGLMAEAFAAKRPAVIHVKIDPDALNTLRKDLFKTEK